MERKEIAAYLIPVIDEVDKISKRLLALGLTQEDITFTKRKHGTRRAAVARLIIGYVAYQTCIKEEIPVADASKVLGFYPLFVYRCSKKIFEARKNPESSPALSRMMKAVGLFD